MTLPDAVLWSAALVSGVSALVTRRLTFWPLLASLGVCTFLQARGFYLNNLHLIIADAVTACAIAAIGWASSFHALDRFVLGLFVLVIPIYFLPDDWRFWGGWAVVVTQFLITVPWGNVWGRALRTLPHNPWDVFDLRVRGEVA